jgi:hypothetical protein
MRSDFGASGSAILSKLGDVDFVAGGVCSYAESDNCIVPKDAAILPRLASVAIDGAFGDAAF